MKDSGVKWIGEIPEDWKVCKIKNICKLIGSGTTPSSGNLELYDNGTINWIQSGDLYGKSRITDVSTKITEKALIINPTLRVYEAPYIVIAMYGASVGNTAISNINACTNQACCCIKTNNINDLYFLFYWINFCKADFLYKAEGGGQSNISQEKIKNEYFVAPQLQVQQKISLFLDKKCSEIDSLYVEIQEQIKVLEEYKRSVITEIITKGLNSDVKMKKSGIEGIEMIPKHWKEVRFYSALSIVEGLVSPMDEKYKNMLHIGPGNIEKFNGHLLDCMTAEEEGLISGKYLFDEECIIYGKINPQLGKVCMPGFTGLCSADAYAFKTKDGYNIRFIFYCMLSHYFLNYTISKSMRMGMPKINREELIPFKFAIPPFEEQIAIASYLDKKFEILDSTIADKKHQLSILEQYKKSLIYEYVTGKKEVPA